MRKLSSRQKKAKQFVKLVYNNEGYPDKFFKNYSQLLNSHFELSKAQQSKLRRTATSFDFRTRSYKGKSFDKIKECKTQFKLNKVKSSQKLSQSVEIQKTNYNSNKNLSKFLLNPENQQKINQILLTKTFQVENDSYKNVTLNKMLKQNTIEKNDLVIQIQRIKRQIANQKKIKAKTSINLGKVMNRNQQTANLLEKTRKQRLQMNEQTQVLQKVFNKEKKRNQRLVNIHENNLQRIKIEKQLINGLQDIIEATKVKYYEMKTYLNQIKCIYMNESNCLIKNKMNFSQSAHQRDKMCKAIKTSVIDLSGDARFLVKKFVTDLKEQNSIEQSNIAQSLQKSKNLQQESNVKNQQ